MDKQYERVSAAVLGPRGTFTERILVERVPKEDLSRIVFADTLRDIGRLVEIGCADIGVLPTEDSIDGDVPESLKVLRNFGVEIIAEWYLRDIRYCLLGKESETRLERIGSHPKSLFHCMNYLDIHFHGLPQIPVRSTADAALRASQDPTFGAISDERCAGIYGLKVLRTELHDYGSHTTRFLVITREGSGLVAVHHPSKI